MLKLRNLFTSYMLVSIAFEVPFVGFLFYKSDFTTFLYSLAFMGILNLALGIYLLRNYRAIAKELALPRRKAIASIKWHGFYAAPKRLVIQFSFPNSDSSLDEINPNGNYRFMAGYTNITDLRLSQEKSFECEIGMEGAVPRLLFVERPFLFARLLEWR